MCLFSSLFPVLFLLLFQPSSYHIRILLSLLLLFSVLYLSASCLSSSLPPYCYLSLSFYLSLSTSHVASIITSDTPEFMALFGGIEHHQRQTALSLSHAHIQFPHNLVERGRQRARTNDKRGGERQRVLLMKGEGSPCSLARSQSRMRNALGC